MKIILGHCVDCGQPCQPCHVFIVRGEIWREAGMGHWPSGYLHQHCLEKRIGRELAEADLLVWTSNNGHRLHVMPDYLLSPEFLLHGGLG